VKSKVVWSAQVAKYVRSQSPELRRVMGREIKKLSTWNGRENPPAICHLEDDLSGYSRLRIKSQRVVFRQDFENGQRVVKCLFAMERHTFYEVFRQLLLDELAS
jgi:mRNA-degrading endonuclease RelE of RelBE toxin-antitoxin system